ncbi:MAG: AraC family transcriptional regulator [Acidobacteriota bacterium]
MNQDARNHSAFLRDPDLPFLESRDSRIAGSPFGVHTHDTFAISVVKGGSTMLDCRGGQWLVPAGCIVFLPPGEPHACNPRPDGEFLYRMFYVERTWFQARYASAPASGEPPGLDLGHPALIEDPIVIRAFLDFAASQDRRAPAAEKLAQWERAMDTLLACVPGHILSGGKARAERRAARMAARVIAERPEDPLSMAGLAQACGVSPTHLPRIFRQTLGLTPLAYQNQLRVELAKRLLASGTPIAQAAAQAGFADQSHLNRMFRRYAGATPRQYMLGSRG